ncbi:hypothetical protein QMW82_10400 [Cronobacter sakazakii]|nr:hypothetical protein [Cronobacter sakazakii]
MKNTDCPALFAGDFIVPDALMRCWSVSDVVRGITIGFRIIKEIGIRVSLKIIPDLTEKEPVSWSSPG